MWHDDRDKIVNSKGFWWIFSCTHILAMKAVFIFLIPINVSNEFKLAAHMHRYAYNEKHRIKCIWWDAYIKIHRMRYIEWDEQNEICRLRCIVWDAKKALHTKLVDT